MKFIGLVLAGALAFCPALAKAENDPFAGWSPAQLKVKILQLQKENAELKAKASSAPVAAAPAAAKASADMLVDDFEGDVAKNGNGWWNGCDDNKLGTTLSPQPYAAAAGGVKGKCNRISGHLGANHEPWPWAQTGLKFSDPNISGYSGISFWAKGDGKRHKVQLQRTAVTDFAHYYAEFEAPKAWTKVVLPFSSFAQPATWGAKVPAAWNDVETIQFLPGSPDADFDFSIDDLVLTK